MQLANQVCTLDQAIKLKSLGIDQVSDKVWGKNNCTLTETWSIEGDENEFYSAYSVAELGVMLPSGYDTMHITGNGWAAYDLDGETVLVHYKTEAECRAAMIIHLLGTNIITAEECNKRLLES